MSFGDIAGSTLSGAAAGNAIVPGIGGLVGGGVGLLSGLFGSNASKAAEADREKAIAREKAAAGVRKEARSETILLNQLQTERSRRDFSQRAMLSNENIKAAGSVSGFAGSSIMTAAQSSVKQQKGSGLQFSYLTQHLGERISALQQEAEDVLYGVSDRGMAGEAPVEDTAIGSEDSGDDLITIESGPISILEEYDQNVEEWIDEGILSDDPDDLAAVEDAGGVIWGDDVDVTTPVDDGPKPWDPPSYDDDPSYEDSEELAEIEEAGGVIWEDGSGPDNTSTNSGDVNWDDWEAFLEA